MVSKLFAASIWTLSLLVGMLVVIILLISQKTGHISIGLVFAITILINIVMWLIGPRITDWIQRIFYKAVYFKPEQFAQSYPELAKFISAECQKNNTPFPKVGFIDDDNPTAFSYGSGKWNSRVVFTRGILTYLEKDEVEAVLAHELGHIVHRDFIVMSIANSIIQLLYEIYYIFSRGRGNSKEGGGYLALIGLLAFVFYTVGIYIVLFLNRLREYYADEFSAQTTGRADALENALIKIAYGIMAKEDTAAGKRLLESTKTMGIMSLSSAKSAALAVKVTNMEPEKVAKVMLFDIVSPWAKLAQLGATHPLTGRRLLRLERMAAAKGIPERFNLEAARQSANLNRIRLWRGFFAGSIIYFLPWLVILGSVGAFFLLSNHHLNQAVVWGSSFAIIFSLMLLRVFYRLPSVKNAPAATVYELMTDLYANPLRGKSVAMNGSIIGRGMPGYVFGEDMMMQDDTGILYLDYRGRVPLFSNLMFALRKVKSLIGQKVAASGWFYRSNVQYLRLKKVESSGTTFKSYPRLWGIVGSFFLAALLSLLLAVATKSSVLSSTPSSTSMGVSSRCYSIIAPSFVVSGSSNCSIQLASSLSAAIQHQNWPLTFEVDARWINVSFDNDVATWNYSDPNYVIASRTKTTVAGLPAWRLRVVYKLDSSIKIDDYLIDSSGYITSGSKPYLTEAQISYTSAAQSQTALNYLNALKIKKVDLSSGNSSPIPLSN